MILLGKNLVFSSEVVQQVTNEVFISCGVNVWLKMLLFLVTISFALCFQSCDRGNPSLRCTARQREGTGDTAQRDWRKLERASLWTHPGGTQPDTQRHGWRSVCLFTSEVFRTFVTCNPLLSTVVLQSWTHRRSWRRGVFVASLPGISRSTLRWSRASSRTVIWLVRREESSAAQWCPKCRQFFPKERSLRGSE